MIFWLELAMMTNPLEKVVLVIPQTINLKNHPLIDLIDNNSELRNDFYINFNTKFPILSA